MVNITLVRQEKQREIFSPTQILFPYYQYALRLHKLYCTQTSQNGEICPRKFLASCNVRHFPPKLFQFSKLNCCCCCLEYIRFYLRRNINFTSFSRLPHYSVRVFTWRKLTGQANTASLKEATFSFNRLYQYLPSHSNRIELSWVDLNWI